MTAVPRCHVELFQTLRTERALAAENGVEFFERWEAGGKEEAVAMKPLTQVPMLLLCGPKKTLTPVNRRGKRRMRRGWGGDSREKRRR